MYHSRRFDCSSQSSACIRSQPATVTVSRASELLFRANNNTAAIGRASGPRSGCLLGRRGGRKLDVKSGAGAQVRAEREARAAAAAVPSRQVDASRACMRACGRARRCASARLGAANEYCTSVEGNSFAYEQMCSIVQTQMQSRVCLWRENECCKMPNAFARSLPLPNQYQFTHARSRTLQGAGSEPSLSLSARPLDISFDIRAGGSEPTRVRSQDNKFS